VLKPKKLIWQLYPSYLLLVLLTLAATGWYAGHSMRTFYLSQIHQNLLNQAHLMADQFVPLLDPLRASELDRRFKALGRQVPTRLTLILPDGRVVADSEAWPAEMENHAGRPEIQQAFKGNDGSATRFSGTLHQRMLYVAIPIRPNGSLMGVMRASIAADAIDRQLRALQIRILLGGVIIAVLASLVCLVISRRITRPIEAMRQGAARYAEGDLSHRLHPPDTRELAGLAEAMNQMAQELEGRIQAVIRQRNESQAVLSSMVEGVIALSPEERIMSINEAAARLLHRSAGKLQGRSIQEVMRNRDLHRMVRTTLSEGTNTAGDVILLQNGEQILSTHCTLLRDADGRSLGALLVLNDVTQLRRLENMRSDFAANVSHEIKTPLTAIQGFVETLRQGAIREPQEARRFLGIIQKHVTRLTAIIDDLLHLSRLEQGPETNHLTFEIGPVADVMQTAVALVRSKAEEKGIAIQAACQEGLEADMDPDLMEQALVNLLDNAIKYSAPGSRIEVDARQAEAQIRIQVSDQGMGIAAQHLPRLFERFYRVDKARSRKLGGTGLGLAIVKHIIQAHGGEVTVQSTQGRGSTFTLHLPQNSGEAADRT
jgi:two-component system, OmpR family, phosphate regulon sensor histidine kinase PhoR